jgi:large subunit ribosomal protein L17
MFLLMSKSTEVEIKNEKETGKMIEWTNIAKTMSANQDEENWIEQVHYRDSKERDEFMAMCGKDENMTQLYKQCMDLITPGSTIMGELKCIEV